MKSLSINYYAICLFVLLIGVLPVEVHAEEATQEPTKMDKPQDAARESMKADKTGTNPINFTHDLRFYNDYQWLNTTGDGHKNVSTIEYRTPFMDGKWQLKVRSRMENYKGGASGVDVSGSGDTDFRVLTVPYLDMSKKFALAVGLETFLDTATEDALGSGTTSLGPQVFAVFFKPFGGFFDLISPAYQHKFSVHEDHGRSDVEQGFIDLFALKMSKNKQSWFMLNPTFILDYENDRESMLIDFEFGTMLDKYLGTKGHSAYIRPGIGIGGDRSMDYSIEAGYKIIW
jgi:hypothetical protein